MFHSVLMTSLTPLRNTNEAHCWDNRPFTTIWPEIKENNLKDITINKIIKKKPKRTRTVITTEQLRVLEKVFARSKYIDVNKRREIAECLQMDQKCIKIWFQNRRMKDKRKLSDSYDSASDGSTESVSPALETSQSTNNTPDNSYTSYLHHYVATYGIPQDKYYVPDNFNPEIAKNDTNRYENPYNFTSPEYTNFLNMDTNAYKNDKDDSTQYFESQTNNYYHNEEDVYNGKVGSDVQDWPVNIFDTSYL